MPTRIASLGISSPLMAVATSINLSLAAERLESYSSSVAGVKLFSKPFGVTSSTVLPKNWAHSLAVISLTVVNMSAFWAEIFSMECLATFPNWRAFSSPS